MFAETQPDTVVLDLRLPEAKDGLALIREFRAAAPDVRIIVLAGWPLDLEGTPEAQMVNLVLAKPIRTATLVDALADQNRAERNCSSVRPVNAGMSLSGTAPQAPARRK